MENASKALLIAGSMLITIVVVTLIVTVWNNMRELPKTQEQIQEAKELAVFNKKYESYAKNGIKGSDVMTVINMADSHNAKNSENKIDVKIKIKEEIQAQIIHYKDTNNDGKVEKESTKTGITISAKEYSLITNKEDIEKIVKMSLVVSQNDTYYIDNPTNQNYKTEPDNWLDYYVMDNLYAIFKRKRFDCITTEYDANGRIRCIYFVEQ